MVVTRARKHIKEPSETDMRESSPGGSRQEEARTEKETGRYSVEQNDAGPSGLRGSKNTQVLPSLAEGLKSKMLAADDIDRGFIGFGEADSIMNFSRLTTTPMANCKVSLEDMLLSSVPQGRHHNQPKDIFGGDRDFYSQLQQKPHPLAERKMPEFDNIGNLLNNKFLSSEPEGFSHVAEDPFRSAAAPEPPLQLHSEKKNAGVNFSFGEKHQLSPEDIETALRVLREGDPVKKAQQRAQLVRDRCFGILKVKRTDKLSRLPPKSGKDRKKLSNQDSAAARRESEKIYCDVLSMQMALMEPIIAKLENNYEKLMEPVKCVHRFDYRVCPFCASPTQEPTQKGLMDDIDVLLGTDVSVSMHSLSPSSA